MSDDIRRYLKIVEGYKWQNPEYPKFLFEKPFRVKCASLCVQLGLRPIPIGTKLHDILFKVYTDRLKYDVADNEKKWGWRDDTYDHTQPSENLQFYKSIRPTTDGSTNRNLKELDSSSDLQRTRDIIGKIATDPKFQQQLDPEVDRYYLSLDFPNVACNCFPLYQDDNGKYYTRGSPGFGGSLWPWKYIKQLNLSATEDSAVALLRGKIDSHKRDGLL